MLTAKLRKFYETRSKQGIVAKHETKLQMMLAALEILDNSPTLFKGKRTILD